MPTFNDVMQARKAIDGYVYETPVINSNALRGRTSHEQVVLKCENLQRSGSYHLRGMMYRVIRSKEMDLGINNFITHSSGNGGQALSCAASSFQSTARVVVPEGTSELVIKGIHHYEGEAYECKPTLESRVAKVQELMERFNKPIDGTRQQSIFVHPYDDEYMISGHGTIGIELMLQTDCRLDCVIVPVGGGALLSGVAIAVKGMKPHVAVFAAELDELDTRMESFKRGELVLKGKDVAKQKESKSAATALKSPLTPRTFSYIQHYVDGVIKVTEEQNRYAFRYVYERCKLVIDANAATAVAAVLARPPELARYRRVGIVLSGGNIDLSDVPKLAAARL